MDLSNVDVKIVEELVETLDDMKKLDVGSREHNIAANSIQMLYSTIATANHNSDSAKVQAEKNEQEAILKDEELKSRIENEKEKLNLERVRLENEKEKLKLEWTKLENEKAKEDTKIGHEKEMKNLQLGFDKWKTEAEFQIERDKMDIGESQSDRKMLLEEQKMKDERAQFDRKVEVEKLKLENEITRNDQEQQKIDNEEDWRSTQLELEKQKLKNELKAKEIQAGVTLVDCWIDGTVELAKIAVGVAAFGALLNFEQTGCVTSKGLNWITRMIFK